MLYLIRGLRLLATLFVFLLLTHAVYAFAYARYEYVRKMSPYKLRSYIQWFLPVFASSEMISVLVNDEVNLINSPQKIYHYKNPYLGLYSVSLYFKKFTSELHYDSKTTRNYEFKGKIEIEYLLGSQTVLKKLVMGHLDNVWSSRDNANGFIILFYKVPKDLPPDQEVALKITILEPDQYLQNKYGPVYLSVEKESDI